MLKTDEIYNKEAVKLLRGPPLKPPENLIRLKGIENVFKECVISQGPGLKMY